MAFKMKAQEVFYKTLFGESSPVTSQVKQLISQGVIFENSLYVIKASKNGQVYQLTLTTGTTALIKGNVPASIAQSNKKAIEAWISKLYGLFSLSVPDASVKSNTFTVVINNLIATVDGYPNKIPVIKVIRELTLLGLKESKDMVDAFWQGVPQKIISYPVLLDAIHAMDKLMVVGCKGIIYDETGTPVMVGTVATAKKAQTVSNPQIEQIYQEVKGIVKPTSDVINLRDAKAVGQKVHGTSPGSIYYTLAINPRVKIAARLYKTGTVSFRAEWQGATEEELAKLQSSGMDMKSGDYASIHFGTDGVPIGRIVGAFLMGLGISWEAVITNASQLVEENDGQ